MLPGKSDSWWGCVLCTVREHVIVHLGTALLQVTARKIN